MAKVEEEFSMPGEDGQEDQPVDLSPTTEPPKPNLYVRFLVRFPYIIIIATILISGGLAGIAVWKYPPPSFDKPAKGFETRGTEIMDCSLTHEKLDHALHNRELSLFPFGTEAFFSGNGNVSNHVKRSTFLGGLDEANCPTIYPTFSLESAKYMVFKSKSGSNLFTAESMRDICTLEDKFVLPSQYTGRCRYASVGFYMANLRQKKCEDLDEEDITAVSEKLKECSQFYQDGAMKCEGTNCSLPNLCENGGHIFQLFYYLTDYNFLQTAKTGKPFLTYAQIVLSSVIHGTAFFEDSVDPVNIEKGDVKFFAGFFGGSAKYDLFSGYLIGDVRYFGVAMGLVLIVMLCYLWSPTLMFATVLNVGFSFSIAYFLYFFVMRMKFYPFVNLLGALLLIAVGADDVFIFHDMWVQSKLEKPDWDYAHWMDLTFRHAALSITVTSLTTGAAFFANLVSRITAIRCFGLFAGLGIMANLILMLSWTPAVIVLIDKLTHSCCNRSSPEFYSNVRQFYRKWTKKTVYVYSFFFPKVIDKGRFVWIILFTGLGVGGLVVTFYKPGLQLPHSSEFQLFSDSHPMEQWDKTIKYKFQFMIDKERRDKGKIRPMFTWGFHNKDNGNLMDPDDIGTLELNKNFKALKPSTQITLSKFCHKMKNQSFLQPNPLPCFYDQVHLTGQELCRNTGIQACCDNSKFPFPENIITDCFIKAVLIAGPDFLTKLALTVGQPIFDQSNNIVALVMRETSTFDAVLNYEKMDEAYNTIHTFMMKEKHLHPEDMDSVCFSGNGWQFRFYDLQRSIATGTYSSIGLSLGVAAGVMLLTSRNVLITVYAIFTILLAIAVTVGTLVLMGWELNILESIAISLSVGLSIDFTIHYGVAYRVSRGAGRCERMYESFHRVGWAVAVAALTTFLAGTAMLPSRILAYTKLGVFLMLVMSYSWIYATFLFQSLCRVMGPQGKFCQIPSPFSCCKTRSKRAVEDQEMEFEKNGSVILHGKKEDEQTKM